MRILFLSNFFPPARPGGYTQWCHEVGERLAHRGHQIAVLTSSHEHAQAPPDERNIFRLLALEGDLNYYQPLRFFSDWQRQHRQNLHYLERIIRNFAPDLVFVWGMWALSRALPARAESLLPGRVVYYLSDYWPSAMDMHTAYWQLPARRWPVRPLKWLLSKIAMALLAQEKHPDLKFEHAICVSARVRDLLLEAGVPIQNALVIHGGTDVARFADPPQRDCPDGNLRMLYAGQLVPHKGVHTAIEAMARLVNGRKTGQVHLTVVGSGHPDYESLLRRLVAQERLDDYVAFRQPVSKDMMAGLMQQFDVLVFPSIYEEPLARITQEAMAAGMVVIGTATGGTVEILRHGETGLTFAPGDAAGLAAQITRLRADQGLCRRLASAGRRLVLERFTLDKMTNEIEAYLLERFAAAPTA